MYNVHMKSVNLLRRIDRAILVIVSLVLILSGFYLAGPWYIPVVAGSEQPIFNLFSNPIGVQVYGIIQLIVGVSLVASVTVKAIPRAVVSGLVFTAFAVRLYSTIGV